jgi:hypothetical protein
VNDSNPAISRRNILAGYEVVVRDTTDLEWEDNFYYGVRAVDRTGNLSPVSFPTGTTT